MCTTPPWLHRTVHDAGIQMFPAMGLAEDVYRLVLLIRKARLTERVTPLPAHAKESHSTQESNYHATLTAPEKCIHILQLLLGKRP